MIASRINGEIATTISIQDRGLNYGDGVFETILMQDHNLHFWQQHFLRLKKGCDCLGINCPDESWLLSEIRQLVAGQIEAVVKIIITRGASGRGYLASADHAATTILSLHELPGDIIQKQQGIQCALSQHPLVINPALAGIKHLNRIDQVIARNEWQDSDIAEVLLTNLDGQLIEGSSSNLFFVRNKTLITAAESDCAVAGIIRQNVFKWINECCGDVIENTIEQTLLAADLKNIEEVFVCNSIWGIVPVLKIIDHENNILFSKEAGKITKGLQQKFQESLSESGREDNARLI